LKFYSVEFLIDSLNEKCKEFVTSKNLIEDEEKNEY